jgi:hypothetical protein
MALIAIGPWLRSWRSAGLVAQEQGRTCCAAEQRLQRVHYRRCARRRAVGRHHQDRKRYPDFADHRPVQGGIGPGAAGDSTIGAVPCPRSSSATMLISPSSSSAPMTVRTSEPMAAGWPSARRNGSSPMSRGRRDHRCLPGAWGERLLDRPAADALGHPRGGGAHHRRAAAPAGARQRRQIHRRAPRSSPSPTAAMPKAASGSMAAKPACGR